MFKYSVLTLILGFGVAGNVHSAIALTDSIKASGDIRTGYFTLHRDDRDGSSNITDEQRLRVRAGLGFSLSDSLSAKIRLAGRYSTDDSNQNHFEFFESIPAPDGLRRGDSTVDELYLKYSPSKQWQVKLGRMQTKFELDGVAKKSLSRNDSPNTDITWTDGVYVKFKADNGWDTNVILQYNPNEGATEVRRGPLDFDKSNSHMSYFVGWENKKSIGPVVQRGFGITYLPDTLQKDGTASGRIEDYWGFAGRMAAQWPIMSGGTKFMLGGELGYAPETPTKAAISTVGTDDTSGVAANITLNLIDFYPRHSIGLVLARVHGGWLLSPDYRNNNNLLEVRYKWNIVKNHRLEARIRNRKDIDIHTGAIRKRDDNDLYIRYTYKF